MATARTATVRKSRPSIHVVTDPLEQKLSAYMAAVAAHESHYREKYQPLHDQLGTADEARISNMLAELRKLEEEDNQLFGDMADLEVELMEWRGGGLLGAYARLYAMWGYMVRASFDASGKFCGVTAEHESYEVDAIRHSLDALAAELGRPGSSAICH